MFFLFFSQVFGKLVCDGSGDNKAVGSAAAAGPHLEVVPPPMPAASLVSPNSAMAGAGSLEDQVDLKEHMVGILFSRSKLTHLQKQVRTAIRRKKRRTVIY